MNAVAILAATRALKTYDFLAPYTATVFSLCTLLDNRPEALSIAVTHTLDMATAYRDYLTKHLSISRKPDLKAIPKNLKEKTRMGVWMAFAFPARVRNMCLHSELAPSGGLHWVMDQPANVRVVLTARQCSSHTDL